MGDPLHFIALYYEQPDKAGHAYRPFSSEYKQMIKYVDVGVVGYLLKRLNESGFLKR